MSNGSRPVSGLLNIDKPKGITSHDVVARIRKLTGQAKVGHTGTLDPMATGVLLVCLGQATRLIEFLIKTPKKYRATLRFGLTTDTLDADGQVLSQNDTSTLTESYLRATLLTFRGEIEQIPPIFSALKKDGQPLYKRARAGQPVQVDPRLVTIYDLSLVDWQPPDLTIDLSCSPGTYVRALARDMGQAVGTGAHLSELVRTANGTWSLDQAVSLAVLEQTAAIENQDWRQHLHPPDRAIVHLPKVIRADPACNCARRRAKLQGCTSLCPNRRPPGDLETGRRHGKYLEAQKSIPNLTELCIYSKVWPRPV
jgi:tRNA pseudouridine55 synthase